MTQKLVLDKEELEQYVHMYFTQETIDYWSMETSSVEFPWKFCDHDDFLKIDKRDHHHDEPKNNHTP